MVGCSADELKAVLDAIAESLTGDPVTRAELQHVMLETAAQAQEVCMLLRSELQRF